MAFIRRLFCLSLFVVLSLAFPYEVSQDESQARGESFGLASSIEVSKRPLAGHTDSHAVAGSSSVHVSHVSSPSHPGHGDSAPDYHGTHPTSHAASSSSVHTTHVPPSSHVSHGSHSESHPETASSSHGAPVSHQRPAHPEHTVSKPDFHRGPLGLLEHMSHSFRLGMCNKLGWCVPLGKEGFGPIFFPSTAHFPTYEPQDYDLHHDKKNPFEMISSFFDKIHEDVMSHKPSYPHHDDKYVPHHGHSEEIHHHDSDRNHGYKGHHESPHKPGYQIDHHSSHKPEVHGYHSEVHESHPHIESPHKPRPHPIVPVISILDSLMKPLAALKPRPIFEKPYEGPVSHGHHADEHHHAQSTDAHHDSKPIHTQHSEVLFQPNQDHHADELHHPKPDFSHSPVDHHHSNPIHGQISKPSFGYHDDEHDYSKPSHSVHVEEHHKPDHHAHHDSKPSHSVYVEEHHKPDHHQYTKPEYNNHGSSNLHHNNDDAHHLGSSKHPFGVKLSSGKLLKLPWPISKFVVV